MKTSRRTLAAAVLTFTAGFAVQASALPVFSFTEHAGFSADVGMAKYGDPLAGDSSLIPAAGPLYSTMSWVGKRPTRSSLALSTVTSPAALMTDTWTTISTLSHDNKLIQGSNSWFDQNIWGRLIISDADGGLNRVVDSDSVISLNLTETKNNKACASPNPVGTACDDYFTIMTPLNDLFFAANDGSQWMATFRFANLVNATQIANVVYTGEGITSSVDVQVLLTSMGAVASRMSEISSVPEPATLVILCLGLFGLGIAGQHRSATLALKKVR